MYIFVPHCFPRHSLPHCNALCLYIGSVSATPFQGEAEHPLSIADREASSAGSGGPEVILELLAFGAAMG